MSTGNPHTQSSTSLRILDGRVIRAERAQGLAEEARRVSVDLGRPPKLAIIQVGDRADSDSYIKAKRSFAEQIGVETIFERFAEDVSGSDVIARISSFNADGEIDGIIVQLPLPQSLQPYRDGIIDAIDPCKDVDGLTTSNQDKLSGGGKTGIVPATARGVMELLDYYHIDLKAKNVVVVGRSALVGAPVAQLCRSAGGDVIVCHSKTEDLVAETKKADVLIVAVGRPGLIGSEHVKHGAVVVDIGINRENDDSLTGDVDFEAVEGVASAITPVPGGVGQMTVVALFENLIDACKRRPTVSSHMIDSR